MAKKKIEQDEPEDKTGKGMPKHFQRKGFQKKKFGGRSTSRRR